MAHRLAHVHSTWEDVLVQLRRVPVSWRGIPLSERDYLTYTEGIVLWGIHLMDISSPYGTRPMREYVSWAMQIARVDVDELACCLSDLVKLCREIYKPMPDNWFKRQLRDQYPFVGVLLSPVDSIIVQFLRKPNAGDFASLYQFFSFLTHLTLQDIDLDLESEYVELEENLRTFSYDPDMISELNLIMQKWFSEFKYSEETFRPYHGPGACAEFPRSAGNLKKYRALGSDPLLDYFVSKYVGVSVRSFLPFEPVDFDRTSVLVIVPKSLKTKRTISKEPASLVYFQEAVKDMIVSYVKKHPVLKSHIDFSNQELNGELALVGSSNGALATVDLSSASDCVTKTLVKSVFYHTPLYPALVSLRSNSVKLPSGKVLRIEKYAPMGSALCFPVETLIFSAIVEYTARRVRRQWGYDSTIWRVFGDDIIVEEPCYWDLIRNLEKCGFRVNTSKSYSQPYRFRESCGYEGYDGIEVTPLKISRRFISVEGMLTSCHAPQFEGLIDLANLAYLHQLPLLRAWIVRSLLQRSPAPPLFSESGDGALYSPVPDNYRARFRPWTYGASLSPKRPWFQVETIQVTTAIARPLKTEGSVVVELSTRPGEIDSLDEMARYWETLRLIEFRSDDKFLPGTHLVQVPRGSLTSMLVTRWVQRPFSSSMEDGDCTPSSQ